jgi:translocation and assembly module TamA
VGLRYNFGFGPLRLDVATPLNPRKGDARVQVYISIGQAF